MPSLKICLTAEEVFLSATKLAEIDRVCVHEGITRADFVQAAILNYLLSFATAEWRETPPMIDDEEAPW